MTLSGMRAMWVLVMFDLPVLSKRQRKAAATFRKNLIQDGFDRVQFSVYSRPCPSDENATVHIARVKAFMPPDGQVRILRFTDKQYARMECYLSRTSVKPESRPEQIQLF